MPFIRMPNRAISTIYWVYMSFRRRRYPEGRKITMPTPRKTIAQLALTGTLSRHSGRYQSRIASKTTVISPIGKAPTFLSPHEKTIWAEIVRTAPPGVLTKSERIGLEVIVKLVARMRTDQIKPSELNTLFAMLGRYGMNPADRLKMNLEPLPEPKTQSEQDARWAELEQLD
jgi:hypothetical protein